MGMSEKLKGGLLYNLPIKMCECDGRKKKELFPGVMTGLHCDTTLFHLSYRRLVKTNVQSSEWLIILDQIYIRVILWTARRV